MPWITEFEYRFLVMDGEGLEPLDFYRSGLTSFTAGFIDELGCITRKGEFAIRQYEKKQA